MDEKSIRQAKQHLLERMALSPAEIDLRLGQALDPGFWRRFGPDLSIENESGAKLLESYPPAGDEVVRQCEKIRREGYFQTQPIVDTIAIGRMRALVEKLREAGWPPVFSYVYDEFWDVVRTPTLKHLISEFLGEGYRQNSFCWTYYVARSKGAGWPPHTDSGDRTSRLTVWVPLSEATLDNGCIYVVPADRMPADFPSKYHDVKTVTQSQLGTLLQAARALPSPPGAYLGWHHGLIHWGSFACGQTAPRISMAVEFVAAGASARKNEEPLFDMHRLPSFSERIETISKGIQLYAKFEPLMNRYRELSERMTQEVRK